MSISNSLHDSTPVSLRQVHDAIMLNDPDTLEHTLSSVGPTKDPPGVIFNQVSADDLKNTFGSYNKIKSSFVSFLHIAVYNCDRVARIYGQSEVPKALKVLDISEQIYPNQFPCPGKKIGAL